MIFIFDGKPPENKQLCINERKEKSKKALEKAETCQNEEEKLKLKRASLRITGEMINDVENFLIYWVYHTFVLKEKVSFVKC